MELNKNFIEKYDNLMGENVEDALEFSTKALKESNNPDYYAYIADCYLTLGDFEKTVEVIDKGLNYNCNNKIYGQSLKGEALFYMEKYIESKNVFEDLYKEDNHSFFVIAYLMDIYIKLKEYKKAIDIGNSILIEKILNKNDEAYIKVNIGWVKLKYLNDVEEAYKDFTEALSLDNNIGRSYIGIGEYHLIKEEFKEAIISFEKAIDLEEGTIDVYFGIAMCYKGLNMYEDAYEYLKIVCDAENENSLFMNEMKIIKELLKK